MRLASVVRERRLVGPAMRDHGLRHPRLRKRWRDDWSYLMSIPANRAWIEASIAELDAWRAARGAPPFKIR
ncbi:MAG TPA: hypothetical protein VF541_17340 [Longimicrobium sp.]|jgi:hypothetical protein